jgi:3alpha(or 20beta)-hydroxysteroid dehydrogenase
MGKLDGKVALITGAARGQGEAEARLFVEEGAQVVLGDMRDDLGKQVAESLGNAATYLNLDVTHEESWAEFRAGALETFGKIDVLVNNAGILKLSSIAETSLDDYMEVIQVNQVGVFLGMKAVLAPMTEAGGGSIVNISSVGGLVGVPGMVSYVSSKFAVRGMTKTAALEFGAVGIRVNSVHPGAVDTPMIAPSEAGGPAADLSNIRKGLPLQRISDAAEIAKLVAFLASDESSYCTGSEFTADGGMLAGMTG